MPSKIYALGEFENQVENEIGKQCKIHNRPIKNGRFGNWCGGKDKYGRWCSGEVAYDPCPKCEGGELVGHSQQVKGEMYYFAKCHSCGYSEGMA